MRRQLNNLLFRPLLRSSLRFGTIRKVWLRGVDLFPSPALIPRKLLIRRYAKLAQLAKKAILSYTFFTLSVLSRLVFSMPLLHRHYAFLTP